ncbi:hypothetical protein [Streptomyces hirsutus]|uniref:hypothetical protein n=1 Tax=Streptomyces hirsutus TaxID=35620 RepID=UPI0036797134
MQLQQFDEAELQAKAVQLGLVQEGQALPRNMRSKMAAALLEEKKPRTAKAAEPVCAKEIVVQPGGDITVDGEPFPWLVARVPMEIGLNPGGVSTVRLTVMAEAVQVLKPKPETKSKESE